MTTSTPTPPSPSSPPTLSDEDLVPRLALRDEAAAALLLERWWGRAYRLALQLVGEPGAAEDVAQEAFVQALRAADDFDPSRGAFAPWLLRIVHNAAFNAARARRRRAGHEAAAARPEVAPDDPAAQAVVSLEAAGLRGQLSALSPQYREAVALHYLHGLTFQEVSQVLGCPPGTVASRVRRGLETLRRRLTATATSAAASAGAAAPLALPAGDDDLAALVARAFAEAPTPAAPAVAALLAGAATAPVSSASTEPAAASRSSARPSTSRWVPRGAALLALITSLTAGTATLALLLQEPLAPPPRRVVVMQPPTSQARGAPAVDVGRPVRATGLVAAAPRAPAPGSPVTPLAPARDEVASEAVEAVAYDATGERVLAGRRDGTAEVWDLREGVLVHRLVGHAARVTAVAFTRDGALAVTASYDGAARVWELAGGSCVHVLQHATGARRRVLALAVSPDGQEAVTGGEDGRVTLWALGLGQAVRERAAHTRPVRALNYEAGGARLLSAGEDHRLVLWSRQGDPLLQLESDAGFSHALLDGQGVVIAAGGPRAVERFDLARRERVGAFAGEGPLALTPPLARTPRLLLRAGAGALRLVDPETGAEDVRLVDDDDVLLSWALSPDGIHALSGAESGRLKVWDLRADAADAPTTTLARADRAGGAIDVAERVVVTTREGADEGSPARVVLPGAREIDPEALRRELATASRARRRELVGSLDPRDVAASLLVLVEALAGAWADWTVRQAAVEALARRLGDPRVQAAVVHLLDRGALPPAAREGLALALGATGNAGWGPRLGVMLREREWVVRRAAAIALGEVRAPFTIEGLIKALAEEPEPRAAALMEETLERLTRADREGATWEEWWKAQRKPFELPRATSHGLGPSAATSELEVEVGRARGRDGRVRARHLRAYVRGQGPPVLVLPDTGYRPDYLATCLRWLEQTHTVVYADGLLGATKSAEVARLLVRLREGLVRQRVISDAPEVVVAHGLAGQQASAYARLRPTAAGLLLVSPFSSAAAWAAAVARVEREAVRQGNVDLTDAARLLLLDRSQAEQLPAGRRAALRRDLFTSYFADTDDLLIGHLLGRLGAEGTHAHELERDLEPRPPREAAAAGWHQVPVVVLVGRRTPWDSPEDAHVVAAQSTRGQVVILDDAARMAPYEAPHAFADAVRALGPR